MEQKTLPETKILDMLNTAPQITPEQAREIDYLIHRIDDPMAGIRVERSRLLGLCDWTQAVDVPLSDEQKQAWRVYRQSLRDLTQEYTAPEQVVWPTPPSA